MDTAERRTLGRAEMFHSSKRMNGEEKVNQKRSKRRKYKMGSEDWGLVDNGGKNS